MNRPTNDQIAAFLDDVRRDHDAGRPATRAAAQHPDVMRYALAAAEQADTTPAPAAAPLPGVALIKYNDGTSEYRYEDDLQDTIARAEAAGRAPVVQTPAAAAPATVARPALIEPWMVRGTVGLGLAGGVVALAPVAASAAAEFSAAMGSLLHIALQVGGVGLAALVLVRLLAGRKTGGGQQIEVVQTVTQTITNVVRIGE